MTDTSVLPYKVADLTLADFGRREIDLAQVEMPGLMALRTEYGTRMDLRWSALAEQARTEAA